MIAEVASVAAEAAEDTTRAEAAHPPTHSR